jgi:hypothetical protein
MENDKDNKYISVNISTKYENKINNIKSSFFSALEEFKKYYVYYNKNPEVNEFQNYYSSAKGQLQSLSKGLIVLTNDINKSIETLNKSMIKFESQLKDEKKINKDILKKLKNLENTQNGSEILIDDSKEQYNLQYYYNIEIFIGIIIISGFLSKIK